MRRLKLNITYEVLKINYKVLDFLPALITCFSQLQKMMALRFAKMYFRPIALPNEDAEGLLQYK